MKNQVRWSLSVMMFLQYAIWGAWSPDFSAYMEKLGFSGAQAGMIYSLLPIGCMLAPFAAGQLADRYFSTEKLLAVFHLLGGGLLFVAASITHYDQLWPVMLGWALVYAPTLALTNSICFHHMPEAEKEFGLVRVWGTIGWIVAGLTLSLLLRDPGIHPETASNELSHALLLVISAVLNVLQPILQPLRDLLRQHGADGLWFAGTVSIGLGLFSFLLPHTPAQKKGGSPWAFLSAIKLLRDSQFAVFIVISFVVATELMFYYVLTAPFLESVGIKAGQAPAWMTIAQIAEIGTMLALPWMLARWGVRKTMLIGILAWPVRYAVFAIGNPLWLVVAALSLHGLCYVCFFTVSYIYVNQVAPDDIKASAQGLITFVTLGAGMFLGSNFAGYIKDTFTTGSATNYTKVFLVPLVLTTLCAVAFMLGFRERAWKAQTEATASR